MAFFVYAAAVLKNVVYGLSVFFTGALSESTDVLDILALRFLLTFVVLWLLKVTRAVKISVGVKDFFTKGERAAPIRTLLLVGLFEPVLYMFFETLGISMTTGITAAVILSLAPISSCVCEEFFLKEKSTLLQKIFLAIGIVGVIYIAVMTDTSTGENSILGILLLVAAVVSGSLYATFSRKSARHFNTFEVTYVSTMLGAFAFNLANVVRHLIARDILHYFDPFFNWQNVIGFIFLGIISSIVATGMNNFALRRMQLSTMAAFSGLSTLVTVAVGVVFANETLYYFHVIGLFLIVTRMVGVSVISIRRERAAKQAEKKQE